MSLKIQTLLVLVVVVACINAVDIYSDVCYDGLGCFTNRPPFSSTIARPIALLPQKPEEIDTKFFLYTREHNLLVPSTLHYNVKNENYLTGEPLTVIIHGFLQNHDTKWVVDLKDAILKANNFNVIVVDWSAGNKFLYTRATANTQLVGAELARLINALVENEKLDVANVHLIGHNLGAHIAGYTGERVEKLGRITGLDPAGPYFENTDRRVRLDETDAEFVDVIHTDGSASTLRIGLGLNQKSGHADFYPNGGKDQPNCPSTSVKLLNGILSLGTLTDGNLGCNSLASIKFFIDSVLNKECQYTAYQCSNFDDFTNGKCLKCKNGCNQMGYWARKDEDSGNLYLDTQGVDKFPYCHSKYLVTLVSSNLTSMTQTRGSVQVELIGDVNNSSVPLVFDESTTTLRPGASETRLITSTRNLGKNILGAKVRFTKTARLLSSWLYQDEWSFSSVSVFDGTTQTEKKFCPTQNPNLKSGEFLRFAEC